MASRATRSIIFRRQRVAGQHRAATAVRTSWTRRLVALIVLVMAVFALTAASLVAGVGVGTVYAFDQFTRDLPSVTEIGTQRLPETTMIYDRHGTLLYEVVDPKEGKRTSIPLSEMPPALIQATIAVEDASFFENPGVDIRGIARAFLDNFQAGRVTSGASTITQQLVKNSLLTSRVTYTRKLKEAILAYRLTHLYSKEQILELYLNQNNYGNHAYGVEAAAEAYFGKKAKDLNLAECSMLAGLPQAPSVYNPVVNYTAAKQRQREVLQSMVLHGYIDQATANKAYATPLHIHRSQTILRAPHFVFYVINELVKKFGYNAVYRGGLRVRTTLDYGMEQDAQRIAQKQIAAVASHHVTDASVVAIDPKTGEILTMLGSADYNNNAIDGKFNVALARRQPGSAIKPMTYATAFEKGWNPSTVIVDAATQFPTTSAMWNGSYVPRPGDPKPYSPKNYDLKFHGPMTVRDALGNSMNIPAVKTIMFAGVPAVIRTSQAMGIHTFDRGASVYGLSLTLGGGEVTPLDLTSAYSVLANGGVRHPPVSWLSVTDRQGHVLDQYHPGPGKRVLSPQIAFLITSILSDDSARALEFGTNSGLKLSRPAAAKTGTTDSFRDNWTVGYTPNLAVGVWVGNANNAKMLDIIGITGAGPIWHDFMENSLKSRPVESFQIPPGMVQERVSNLTGLLPASSLTTRVGSGSYTWTVGPHGHRHYQYGNGLTVVSTEPSHVDWFLQGTEPTRRTYRLGTYRAYWGTGQLAAADCPPYMVDVRVWGPDPPPPGVYDCRTGTSSYQPSTTGPFDFGPATSGVIAYPTQSPQQQASSISRTLAHSFPPAEQTAITQALTPVPMPTMAAVPIAVPPSPGNVPTPAAVPPPVAVPVANRQQAPAAVPTPYIVATAPPPPTPAQPVSAPQRVPTPTAGKR